MTTPTSLRSSAARFGLPAARAAMVFLLLATLSSGCRKGEKAGAGAGAENATPEAAAGTATPVPAAADLSPHLAAKADAGEGPFSGLGHPRGIAVDAAGRIWIVDFGHAAVRLFDSTGASFGGWGGHGDGPYAMKDPSGIAVHGDNVYVADTWRTGVERFSTAGEFRGKAAADLYGPHGVAVASDGRVFIADTGDNRIVVCDADLSNPKPIGKAGNGPEAFSAPMGIAIGPSGTVYVADLGNSRIQVLDAQGNFKTRWKMAAWSQTAEPYLDVDGNDNVYISDSNGNAVIRLDHSGRETKRWTAGDDGKKFSRPTGVAIDRKNHVLYVVNTDGENVVRIQLEK